MFSMLFEKREEVGGGKGGKETQSHEDTVYMGLINQQVLRDERKKAMWLSLRPFTDIWISLQLIQTDRIGLKLPFFFSSSFNYFFVPMERDD